MATHQILSKGHQMVGTGASGRWCKDADSVQAALEQDAAPQRGVGAEDPLRISFLESSPYPSQKAK